MTEPEFRNLLQRELTKRCESNENYSLRSFARNLGIPASSLSLIINGTRPITKKTKVRLGLALGLKMATLINERSVRSPKISPAQQIQLKQFEVISDWYHFAILELTKVRDFTPDLKWIASSLGISHAQVRRAVSNLLNLGFLEIDRGVWRDKTVGGFATNITPGMTSEASKEMQRQILTQSKAAVDSVPLELRNHSSLTIAISKNKLEGVKERIRAFRHELNDFLSEDKELDEVYQFTIGFFPITKISRRKK